MDGIAAGAETSLRAHLIEVETCWLEVLCGSCSTATMIPLRMLVRQYGPDAEIGAYVSRLTCKRCRVPPCTVRLQENATDYKGAVPGWSALLINRAAVSASDRGHSQGAAQGPG